MDLLNARLGVRQQLESRQQRRFILICWMLVHDLESCCLLRIDRGDDEIETIDFVNWGLSVIFYSNCQAMEI